MRSFRIIAVATLIVCCGTLLAQDKPLREIQLDSLKNSHKIVYIDGRPAPSQAHADSVRSLIDRFYYDQFQHFQDPLAPYFLFMSKDANLAMGVGGCVRMRGWFDWGGALPANGFAPYLIPMTPDPTNERAFGSTPSGTALFFRVLGTNKSLGDYQLYIEANFNGYKGRDFHLKKAYAIINDWTIGYAPSTFTDHAAEAPTVDAQGASNKLGSTSVLVRWMHTFGRYTAAASIETPSSQIDADNQNTAKLTDWMPDVAAFGQYSWASGQHVRLAGIVRTLGYRDLKVGRNHTKAGWGLQLSSVFNPAPQWTVYTAVNGGQGAEGMGTDLAIGNYDLIATPTNPNAMYAPSAWGWYTGVQYNFRPNLFASALYAQSRLCPRRPHNPDEYMLGQYLAVNMFWNPSPRIMIGGEFDLGCRRNFSGEHRWARRVGVMAQMSF